MPNLIESIESGIGNIKRRPFDRYALGPFMIWFGLKSKSMGKWPRRAMVAGGIYQLVYAWNEYRKVMAAAQEGPQSFLDVIRNESEVT